MTEHRFVDMEYVRNNPNKCWDKLWLSFNKQLTVKDVETLILPNSTEQWDWYFISQYIDIREIRNNPNKPWDKQYLSMNMQLTIKDIDTLILPNSTGEWNWLWVSLYINIQEVINNPNKPWITNTLRHNNNCTSKILEFFDAKLLKHLQMNIPEFRYHTDIVVKCDC